jgi:hypothetical protein
VPELTPEESADAIAERAAKPASASGDGQSASAHPIPDQIAADQYAQGVSKASTTGTGWALLRPARFEPPGAGPGCE